MMRAVIRLRGDINVKPDIKRTLGMMRLNKVNHCVLVPSNKVNDGMLQKVKDYVTWGEIKSDVLARLIVTRGRLAGNRSIDIKLVKELTKYDTLVKFADAVAAEKENYTSLQDVKPVFRLHPPLRGHEGVKRAFKAGGALGYRGEAINDLILKMLGPGKKVPKKPKAAAKKPAGKKKAAPKKPAAKKKEAKPVKKAPAKTKTPAKKREVKK
jgi:large subunit ribosomal protein L30